MFTKSEIAGMNEATFQRLIVEPLFTSMGFHDVYDFSGGSLELGKDIVMWKEGELGERVNYGVVIKAVRISGKAKGPNTASEVLNQVRQCLTSVYADPVTGEQQQIHRCWVISSHIIEKSAIHSIESQLQTFNFDRLVRWIHPGTNLFALIEKHLPEQSIVEQLSSIQAKLDDATKIVPYRIVATTDGSFEIKPKHRNATTETPFNINTQFEFDVSTTEGKKARDNLVETIKTGRPSEIDGKFIKAFKLPDFVPEWLRPQLSDDSKLILGSARLPRLLPLEIRRRLDGGEEFSTGRIDFEIVHHGTEEITLSNERQGGPLGIEFIINLAEAFFTVHINCKFTGYGAYQLLNATRFCAALSKDGSTDIIALELGVKLVSDSRAKLEFPGTFDGSIRLLEDLLVIQEATGTPMFISDKDIKREDLSELKKALHIIETGEITVNLKEIDSVTEHATIANIIESFANEKAQPITVSHEAGLNLRVFGNPVLFAPSVLIADAYIRNDDFKEIQRRIADGSAQITLPFKVVEQTSKIVFPQFGSKNDSAMKTE